MLKKTEGVAWRSLSILLAVGIVVLIAFAVHHGMFFDRGVETIRDTGSLKVLTRNTSTTWFEDREGGAGPEHDLAKSFADYLGVKVQFVVKDGISELAGALEAGEGDLVAAGISRTEARERDWRFGPDYAVVQQQVVCRRNIAKPRGPGDLVGKSIIVLRDSSYAETLVQWREEFPGLSWRSTEEVSTEQIMEDVSSGGADCTLADSNIVAINRRYHPNLDLAFAASEPQSLAWLLPNSANDLAAELDAWFEQAEASGEVAAIMERYYGHVQLYDHVDLKVFRKRIESRLPKFRKLFEKVAREFELPWTLLAAQAYQESHWDPKARSRTGVRGLMMLTLPTARAMKVHDRLDPAQSIKGGARYLRHSMDRLPKEVRQTDRIWLALAAYNVGMGHVRDARNLARTLGKDAHSWYALAEVLPLLSQKRYYRSLKHGYARGTEPVRYVQRIRNYEEILRHAVKN